jgi:alkylation response protein AidB-like acyl-CoA dehydrogenase
MIDPSVNPGAGSRASREAAAEVATVDFGLGEEQLKFQRTCRTFAREVIRPLAPKYDREESVPWEALIAAREWGLHGLEHCSGWAETRTAC